MQPNYKLNKNDNKSTSLVSENPPWQQREYGLLEEINIISMKTMHFPLSCLSDETSNSLWEKRKENIL